MQVRHDLKRSKYDPKVALLSMSAAQTQRRLKLEPHGPIWDENEVYEPDWEISPTDLEAYADIWSRS